jgi:hypothetical protein
VSDEGRPLSASQRWLSRRALVLHLALLVWFPGCLVAFWWQVHRALGGNALSYLYSVEWPAFAVAGAWAWWQLVHTEPSAVGRAAQQRIAGVASAADAGAELGGARDAGAELGGAARPHPVRRREEEDPELAAYNDRLARLAAEGPKGWRRR